MRFSYEGDWDKAWSFFDEAQHELFRLKERMTALGIAHGSFHAVFGNGDAYVYGYVLPTGLEAIHIVVGPGAGDVTSLDFIDPETPDFLSGYLVDGRFVDVDGETRVRDFRAGASCQRLHGDEVSSGRNKVRRLAIRPGDVAGISEGAEIAQATIVRPTMYSGTMRKVVQFLLGIGKQFSSESIYDASEPPLPSEVVEGDDEALVDDVGYETAYESFVKSQGVRLQYDYRFQRTHGVIRAADQRWWLVEISQGRGILMMPLPLCRYTDLPEFREKCERLGDEEALQVLDLFGGFPSGEPFPTDGDAIEAAVRSGRVIRTKTRDDVKSFYEYGGYSSIMGWAFSDSGLEAHNTGCRVDDLGYVRGAHFAAQMTVGAFVDVEPDDRAEELKGIISESQGSVSKQVYAELLWKIDRLSALQVSDLLSLSETGDSRAVIEELDEIVLSPSASATSSFTRVSEGMLYSRALYGPQIKFPEPILGGCVSAPIYQYDASLPAVSCDTTVHVFFIGEELNWVKFYSRPRDSREYVASDTYTGREDIPVGDFLYERHSGLFGVAPGFYTSKIDDRVERGETTYTVRYKRRFSGYYEILASGYGYGDRVGDHIDRAYDPPIPWTSQINQPPLFWRNAKFSYEEWRETRRGLSQTSSVVVPMEDRCSYFYTIQDGDSGGSDTYTFRFEVITDPNVGHYPVDRRDITFITKGYSVGSAIWPNHQERIDFADSGEWVPMGADVSSLVTSYGISLLPFSVVRTTSVAPRFTLKCQFVSASEHAPVVVFDQARSGSDFYPSRWFMMSPDPESGAVDFINATHNCLGASNALVYSQDINSSVFVARGRPDDAVLRSVVPTFIGPFDA